MSLETYKMSENYLDQIDTLTKWFKDRISCPIKLTETEYKIGVDALIGYPRKLTKTAFQLWLTTKQYELSYSQMCVAFFRAARINKLLVLRRDLEY